MANYQVPNIRRGGGMFSGVGDAVMGHPLAKQYNSTMPGMTPSPLDNMNPLMRNMIRSGAGLVGLEGDYLSSQEKQRASNAPVANALTSKDPKALREAARLLAQQGRIQEAQDLLQMADKIQAQKTALLEEGTAEIQSNLQKAKDKQLAERMAQMTTDPEIKEMLRSGAIDPKETAQSIMKARMDSKPVVLSAGAIAVMPNGQIVRNPKAPESSVRKTDIVELDDGSKQVIDMSTGEVIKDLGKGKGIDMGNEAQLGDIKALSDVRAKIQEGIDLAGDDRGVVDAFAQAALGGVPWTDSKEMGKIVNVLTSNLGFDALTDLKARGGTLGQIAVAELEALQSTRESLDPTSAGFVDDLKRLAKGYDEAIQMASGKSPLDVLDWADPKYNNVTVRKDGKIYVIVDGVPYDVTKGGK